MGTAPSLTPRRAQDLLTLESKTVRLYEEAGTGVLVALNEDGGRVNPLRVLSPGRKLEHP